jgi:signal transduction histidine kinase
VIIDDQDAHRGAGIAGRLSGIRSTRRDCPAGTAGTIPGEGYVRDPFAHIALHDNRVQIVHDLVQTAREAAGADSAMAAVQTDDENAFMMSRLDGMSEPALFGLTIRRGLGLGGQVVVEARSRSLEDYWREPSITGDYLQIVKREGLRGIACVPVFGPNGMEILLYVSMHRPGAMGSVTMRALDQVGTYASIGLHNVAARAREREIAQLRERERLASSLHDSVAQALFAIGIAAQQSREAGDPESLAERLAQIETMAADARSELREALAQISRTPEGLALESLVDAEARLFERRTGRHARVTRHGEARTLETVCEQLFADTVREGLANAAKHTPSQMVLVHLAYAEDVVRLSLQTDLAVAHGRRGTEPPAPSIPEGSGLHLLRDRAERLGGCLDLTYDDDRVVLRLELPS